MSESPRCPKCGIPLPADAPAGLCPKCLVQAGFESQPVSASAEPGPTKLTPSGSGFVPPTVEELAPLFPQLEILELLGKGGMGAVYKARQPGLDRLVAVKILPPEISHDPAFAERFQREARALARLSHPHIVAVYDFGTVGSGIRENSETASEFSRIPLQAGLCYIVMEFVDGANLRQAIQTRTLTSAEALAIVPQICEALQFAHDEGIVHRDIKPENILIDKRGRVKIADFGLAKLLGTDGSDHSLTATHQVMGTLRYMAPEQMQGSREVDHRADIYSLGVVFYELLTGELPMGKFAPPSKKVQVDIRLDEVVLRALEQDPEQRYQHASDVKTDLATISSSETSQRLDAPTVASDAIMFRRMTVVNLAMSTVWAALLAGLHAGYLAGADWYFKKELPYNYLTMFWTVASALLAYWLTWWWYLLAKQPDTPRSLANFWSLTQQPDPRAKRIWKPGLVYLAIYLATMLVGLPFSDAVRSTARTVAFGIGPFVCMAILRWTYAERFRDGGRDGHVEAAPVASPALTEPRFSRFAIAGAVWAIFGLLAIIPTLYFIGLNRVWNGTALPTDVIHSEPPLLFSIFMGALLAIGSGAPIGTTIHGGIAIGHIKRSGGKIIGLPLAVADVLFFPLLVLSGLIAALVARVVYSMAAHPNAAVVISAGAFGVLVALVVCFFVARAAWRAIAKQDKPIDQSPPTSSETMPRRRKLLIAIAALLAIGIPVAVWLEPLAWTHKGATSFQLGKSQAYVHQFGDHVGLAVWIEEGEREGAGYSEHLPGYDGAFRLSGNRRFSYRSVTNDGQHGTVSFDLNGDGLLSETYQLVAGRLFLVSTQREKVTIRQLNPNLSGISPKKDGLAEGAAMVKALAESDEVVKGFLAGNAVPVTRTPKPAAAESPLAIDELFTLKGHTGYVHNVRFSPDGTRIASASHDGTAKIWNAGRRMGSGFVFCFLVLAEAM